MKTRVATSDDLARGIELFKQCYAESDALQAFPLNVDKLLAFMAKNVSDKLSMVVEDDQGLVIGVLAVAGRVHFFSDRAYVADIWLYVDKNYRKTTAAFLLLKEAVAHSQKTGMPLIMSVTSGIDLDRKDKLFDSFGFRKLGGIYAWGL
jgi:L-amino acid N-acyltransferase YncA